MNNVKSLPKRKLVSFLQEAEMDVDFKFSVAIPASEALTFVHRMRVELSRFRTKVRNRKRVPKHFKMLYIGVKETGKNSCIITLKKSLSSNDVSEELDEIFDKVAGGKSLDV